MMKNRRTSVPWLLIAGFCMMLVSTAAVARDSQTHDFRFPSGGLLVIDVASGHVEIKTGSSDEVRVTISVDDGDVEDFVDLSFQETRDGLEIIGRKVRNGDRKRSWWFGGGSDDGDIKYEILAPRHMDLEVTSGGGHISIDDVAGEVNVSTGGGHVQIGDIEGNLGIETGGGHIQVGGVDGTLSVDTGGGHVEVEDVRGDVSARSGGGHISIGDVDGDLEVETDGGHIEVERVNGKVNLTSSGGHVSVEGSADDAEIHTRGGDVTLEDMEGHVTVRTGGGDIDVELTSRSTGADLETEDGDIEVRIPHGGGFDVDAHAKHGEVEAPKSARGGILLKLTTHDGDIRISEGR